MRASPFFLWCAATCLLVASLPAQNPQSATIQKLLPPEATIIETADLNLGSGKARALVLWMEHPKQVVRQNLPGCEGSVFGDYWSGPTRVSLVDLAKATIVNTVEVRSPYDRPDDKEHAFKIPFLVLNALYHVPRPNASKEGRPVILDLQDLTGEGVRGQFVVFEHVACAIATTRVIGYSPRSEEVVQYSVEIDNGDKKPEMKDWVSVIFGAKPVRPGYWNFTWDPGHGADVKIHEQVSFDRVRQVFVDKQTVTPYSDLPK